MKDTYDYWVSSEVLPNSYKASLHHEKIALALQAEGVLPTPKESHYGLHLRFVRFLVSVPEDGLTFTRRLELLGSAYFFIRKAIDRGYLKTYEDMSSGKLVVYPSMEFKRLIEQTEPTDQEVIAS